MATLKINRKESRLIFYLYDYGRTKSYDWSIQIETKAEINIRTLNSTNSSLVEVGCRYAVGGFDLKELNTLEKWIKSSKENKSKLELKKDDIERAVLSSSESVNNWEVEVNAYSYVQLATDSFNFDGNYLNNSANTNMSCVFSKLTKKDLKRVEKWIERCRNEIKRIKARKDI